ncbi:MAG: RNA polymerase subunit sigma, partial [Bacillota bacterium]|nr:RNA polymerase subunit sigma [Bacillota bacterium]
QSIDLEFNSEQQDEDGSGSPVEDVISIEAYKNKSEQEQRREEIFRLQTLLAEYDMSFKDLVENSPKHSDARKNAILAAKLLVDNEELKNILLTKKRLPIKQLEQLVEVSRKTLERNRKYIIAIALVLTNDFLYMKDYLKGVLEE